MRIVIVGAGLVAANAVEELRRRGHDESIVVFGDEPHLPYNRPPLSKDYLLGKEDEASIFVHDAQWYGDASVDLRLGTRVASIDLDRRQVHAGTESVGYDRLLVCTGASPRRLRDADDHAGAVAYLRTLEDSRALRTGFRPGARILVVGAGWIGLEVAAAARMAGAKVTVVENADLPLLGVLGPEVATVFADLHRSHGVDLRLGVSITSFTTSDHGSRTSVVRLDDCSEVVADLVVVGIGVSPNDDLARAAGLLVDNGILVDERLQTSDPHVYAAGDVANQRHPVLERRIRVEHWDTAVEQGKAAARSMLGGAEPYARLPYFFTDQYDVGMEYLGNVGPDGYDEVIVRGDRGARFTAFWLKDGRVRAGMHVNDWDALGQIRSIVGTTVAPDLLRDESTDLAAVSARS
ncbi:MAG: FAD-dependent pyridine nucleotide-disulfide oxidoreductase [Marmoricola sp.]|nr:FAD-dependent pyridine nucleotide-disulfide oxidoreductase [Marmoricola sp.]